ncbi:protein rep [Hymenobacter sp. BT18]|uniref:protein rep n=1 Tax=Hymenobacter sp. BT18 TaxID=2835648 RepID=UPI00143EF43C|nr:protein rep [Hymenobacter sp. BT18]QIX59699.1 protein rep [Hymenobacter sp. BT18]
MTRIAPRLGASVHNDRNIFSVSEVQPQAYSPEQRHQAACKFGWRVSQKIRKNRTLASAIDEYMSGFGVELPATRQLYKDQRNTIWQKDAYDDALEDAYGELARLKYALTETRGYYAEFSGEARRRLVPMAFWYSRHRLCYVWNMRKSQLVRSRYYQYLRDARDNHGRLLVTHYRPIHLMLTVPHQGGTYHGQRFYARALIRTFAELRKLPIWKQYVYAGEYGLEVKKSKKHGLHIHVHSLLLQHPQYSVNEVRDALVDAWRTLTGNNTTYSGLHYETLYRFEKKEDGTRVKRYVVPGQSSLDEYLAGVLECIKYHFKPDCLDEPGQQLGYDVALINEILTNTKNLRMYSRFGKFYKEPSLNFNQLEKAADELSDEETADEVRSTVEGVEERLIDPTTMQPARAGSYKIKIGRPDSLKYNANTGDRPLEAWYYEQANCPIHDAPPGLTLKEVIRLDVMGKLRLDAYERFYSPPPSKGK